MLAALPASALAAGARYAAPTASGTGDCSSAANACTLSTAFGGASPGNDVFVLGDRGDYSLGSNLVVTPKVLVHGINGRPRILIGGSFSFRLAGAQSTAEHLYVESNGNSTTFALDGVTNVNLGDSEVLTMFLVVIACGYIAIDGALVSAGSPARRDEVSAAA